jgi:hypothetical protein
MVSDSAVWCRALADRGGVGIVTAGLPALGSGLWLPLEGGLCALPGGEAFLSEFGLTLQGLIVVTGVTVLAFGIMQLRKGAQGNAKGRVYAGSGIAILAAGLLFWDIIAYIAGLGGTGLGDAGAACLASG